MTAVEPITMVANDRSKGLHKIRLPETEFPIRSDVLERYRCIETLLYIEGQIRTNDLRHIFGIGRQQASKDFMSYQQSNPGCMSYDSSVKAYTACQTFSPVFCDSPDEEYIHLLHRNHLLSAIWDGVNVQLPGVEAMPGINSVLRRDVFSAVVRAIRWRRMVQLQYMDEIDGRVRFQSLSLAPTHLVHTPRGWIVRVVDETRGPRNLWLSRICDVPDMGARYKAVNDHRWERLALVHAVPRDNLTADQLTLTIADWGSQPPYVKTVREPLSEVLVDYWASLDDRLEFSVKKSGN